MQPERTTNIFLKLALAFTAALFISGCGGGGGASPSPSPSPTTYTVGGAVSGLSGTVVLQNNAGDNLNVSSNGNFTFVTQVAQGGAYNVTVLTQPVGQVCSVGNGSGTINGGNISDISVTCANIGSTTYSVSVTISGLTGVLGLQNNAGNDLNINSNGNYSFATKLGDGQNYAVTVKTQPAGQTCSVSNGNGMINGSNVSNISVVCSNNSYTVNGNANGLNGTVVIQNNGGDNLNVTGNGNGNVFFTFATPVAQGGAYEVTVVGQPVGQICSVLSGSGTIPAGNVGNIIVKCVNNNYTVGGSVSGLTGTVELGNFGGDTLNINSNGNFTFAATVPHSGYYSATVLTQPFAQTCSVSNGSGTVFGANVGDISVLCSDNSYTVGGAVSGLSGTVVLQNNSGDNLSIKNSSSFTFATPVVQGGTYGITVLSQPSGQICSVGNGNGTISGSNISDVTLTCSNNFYTIGGTVTGLSGSLTLQNYGGDALNINSNGNFTFATPVNHGGSYSVSATYPPAGQVCTVTNASNVVNASNITDIAVECSYIPYSLGGTVSGLTGTVVLQNNGGDDLSVSTGNFTFPTKLNIGNSYNVSVLTQPEGQNCVVNNGGGTFGSLNINSVAVTCTDTYWTKQPGRTTGNAVATDANGNVFVAGDTPGQSGGSVAGFIIKYGADGSVAWQANLGGTGITYGLAITTDAGGNAYVAGRTDVALPGTSLIGTMDGFLVKYNSGGVLQWAVDLGAVGVTPWIRSVAVDNSGNVFVTGEVTGALEVSHGTTDYFIAKYDSSGAKQWVKQFGGAFVSNSVKGFGIAADTGGNVYVTGNTNIAPNGDSLIGTQDFFVAKHDTNGVVVWIKQMGASGTYSTGRSVAVSGSNVYVGGSTSGGLNGNTLTGTTDVFVAQYDTNGVLGWVKQTGASAKSTGGNGVAADAGANVYVGGTTFGALSGNTMTGNSEAFVVKYDNTGVLQWIKQFGLSATTVTGNAVATDANNNLFITGQTGGGLDGNTLSSPGAKDAYVAKFDSTGVRQ